MKKNNRKKKEQTTKNLWDIESKNRFSSVSIDELAKTPQLLNQYLTASMENTFSELLFRLTHEKYRENKAFELWTAIIRHKEILNKSLARDVGILVATLDYLANITGDISNPKIMDDQKIEDAARLATKDALTDLYIRNVFDFVLKIEISKFFRYKTSVSLIMADIDDFKDVNDHYGHQKGDEVLKLIANIFLKNSRQTDLPVRYGGEELAIILAETALEEALIIAERLKSQVFQHFQFKKPTVTISIGVASFYKGITTASELVHEADEALYAAKLSGKNKVVNHMLNHELKQDHT